MKKFNELVATNQNEMTEGERAFVETHQAILRAGAIMAEFTVDLAGRLKTMRDDKLYTAAGFETFEDYTENAIGIKRAQSYKYINVLETLGGDFVHSNKQIGITKLSLLAGLDDVERAEVADKVDVAKVSVRELERQIKALQETNDELESQIEELTATDNTSESEDDVDELRGRISELETTIEKLRALPPKTKTVEKLVPQIQHDIKTIEELAKVKNEMAQQNGLIEAKEQELVRLRKQLANAGDEKFVVFKAKFNLMQAAIKDAVEALDGLDEGKQSGARQAIKHVLAGVAL